MDKVFISKNELTKLLHTQKENGGPFLTAFCMLWLLNSILLFIIPMIVFGILLLILYIPFYFIDNVITKRKKE